MYVYIYRVCHPNWHLTQTEVALACLPFFTSQQANGSPTFRAGRFSVKHLKQCPLEPQQQREHQQRPGQSKDDVETCTKSWEEIQCTDVYPA